MALRWQPGSPGAFKPIQSASSDSGRTWHIAGPILHIDAAQGAIAVNTPGVAGPGFYYAWGNGYNNIVDATTDAGRRWWQTSLPGAVLSVTTETSTTGALVALVEGPTTDPAGHGASLWSYLTDRRSTLAVPRQSDRGLPIRRTRLREQPERVTVWDVRHAQ